MKVRFHRHLLADSMATQFEPKDWEDFCKHCEAEYFLTDEIKCEHYSGADNRIGWKDTWIILAKFNLSTEKGKVYTDGEFYPCAFSDENVLNLK